MGHTIGSSPIPAQIVYYLIQLAIKNVELTNRILKNQIDMFE